MKCSILKHKSAKDNTKQFIAEVGGLKSFNSNEIADYKIFMDATKQLEQQSIRSYGVSGRPWLADDNGFTAVPNYRVLRQIDNVRKRMGLYEDKLPVGAKLNEVVKLKEEQAITVSELSMVDTNKLNQIQQLFKDNPELSQIGTIEQYAAYLDTIFPNSKVKDIVYRGSEKEDSKLFQYFTKNPTEAYMYAKANITKGGNITERNPIPSIYKVLKETFDNKYGNEVIESILLDKDNYIRYNEDGEPYTKFPKWYDAKAIEKISDSDKTLIKNYQRLQTLYDYVKIESESDLMKQYDDIRYIENIDEYKRLRTWFDENIDRSVIKEGIGKITSAVINIVNPYTEEITQEDLQNNRDSYKDGHDGAFLMGGDHFIIKSNTAQIHILGNKQDIEGFKQFVDNKTGLFLQKVSEPQYLLDTIDRTTKRKIDPEVVRQQPVLVANTEEGDLRGTVIKTEKLSNIVFNNQLAPTVNKLLEIGDPDIIFVKDLNFSTIREYSVSVSAINGVHFTDTGKIYVEFDNPNALKTVLHEAIHFFTVAKMQSNPNDPAVKKLVSLFESYQLVGSATLADTNYSKYGLKDAYEFIAEAFSNPEFVETLKYLAPSVNDNSRSFFQMFIDFVAELLGIKRDPLEEILNAGWEVIRKDLPVNRDIKGYQQMPEPSEQEEVSQSGIDNIYYQLIDNKVDYQLRIVTALQSDKVRQPKLNNLEGFFNDIQKQGIPSNQLDLLREIISEKQGEFTKEDLVVDLLSQYSYTIEINTAKENLKIPKADYPNVNSIFIDGKEYKKVGKNKYTLDGNVINYENLPVLVKEYLDSIEVEELVKPRPTSYYSNLTVPGGTNYTENEIATPVITPSIKGHAQFATDKGIGWFRSDDKTILENNLLSNLPNVFQVDFPSGKFEYRKEGSVWNLYKLEGNRFTLFNKNEPIEEVKEAYNKSYNAKNIINSKTRRILEVQSDLFQKGRDKEVLITDKKAQEKRDNAIASGALGFIDITGGKKTDKENQFLQLLNKDNNWVTFFVRAIIQSTAKERIYEASLPDIEEKVLSLQKEGKLKIDCK